MKKIFVLTLVSVFLAGGSISCNSNDDSISNINDAIVQLQGSIKVGTWRVTNFVEDGVNQSHHFTGYVFNFSENGNVSATNGSTTVTGTWTASSSSSGPKFILDFNVTNGPFEEISEDWRIESVTSVIIDLKHISGGDNSIDLLKFEKI